MLFRDRYRDVPPEKINCSIMLLGGRAVEEKFLFKPGSAVMDRAGIYDRLTQAVIRLIEEINDPDIDLEPTSQPDENCPECPYQTICGQQWISRKY
ncbi:hypothetical protein A2Y85_03150 [candidate division WOR-3 bacterium RBG_13_43_14]|uniref:PD-(D/E)XK endonuclease-like domain-containing protein n=1 Tax=candidate division WOR-3 bacterium RBG_13_43_14 TaxID=1802590 RepID=A0A1F4UDC3_UNCW3|nr:MAG: hypothetical protein A2Y85_03150 [candidate division WOR-3 bacterium RBG_13_43_14]